MSAPVIVSVHDVAPGTFDAAARLVEMAHERGIRTTMLVVPGPYRGGRLDDCPAFVDWLRRVHREGHEVALHGWEHRAVHDPYGSRGLARSAAGHLLARGCAEFLELGVAEALRRLRLGREALDKVGFDPVGFVPPGWLASPHVRFALRRLEFSYTTSQWAISDLRTDRTHRIGAISQRPGSSWSAAAGLLSRSVTGAALRSQRSLRVALHPDDLADRHSRSATARILDAVAPRRCTTYADFLGIDEQRA